MSIFHYPSNWVEWPGPKKNDRVQTQAIFDGIEPNPLADSNAAFAVFDSMSMNDMRLTVHGVTAEEVDTMLRALDKSRMK